MRGKRERNAALFPHIWGKPDGRWGPPFLCVGTAGEESRYEDDSHYGEKQAEAQTGHDPDHAHAGGGKEGAADALHVSAGKTERLKDLLNGFGIYN